MSSNSFFVNPPSAILAQAPGHFQDFPQKPLSDFCETFENVPGPGLFYLFSCYEFIFILYRFPGITLHQLRIFRHFRSNGKRGNPGIVTGFTDMNAVNLTVFAGKISPAFRNLHTVLRIRGGVHRNITAAAIAYLRFLSAVCLFPAVFLAAKTDSFRHTTPPYQTCTIYGSFSIINDLIRLLQR